jgi:hypothetical protein
MNNNYCEDNNQFNLSFDSEKSTSDLEISEEEIYQKTISLNDNRKNMINKFISSSLEKLLKLEKKNNYISKKKLEIFNNHKIPNISLFDYLNRIIKYMNCEESTLILSLIYLDRLSLSNIYFSIYNIHRLLFTSILLAIKYNEDKIYKNDYYSKIAGVTLSEINLMEYNFAILLKFNFYVNDFTYNIYKKALEINIPSCVIKDF